MHVISIADLIPTSFQQICKSEALLNHMFEPQRERL